MEKARFTYLFDRYYSREATPEETQEFWALASERQEDLKRHIDKAYEQQLERPGLEAPVAASILQSILAADKKPATVVQPLRFLWYRVAAAAVVLVALVMTLIWVSGRDEQPLVKQPVEQPHQNDIAPGGDKAILTLADGRQIVLDSTTGSIAEESGVTVINLDGQLNYKSGNTASALFYHTITTPKGGQYKVVLADGSKVWLNAASSLHFPSAFVERDRVVKLTGEGYFEVAHDPRKPFHVDVNGLDVQVLGTHFNINAYSDEESVKTTLFEGRVKVHSALNEVLLRPGEQASARSAAGLLTVNKDVSLDEVLAWKNGLFQFEQADIKTIMRQVARWYNVEVVFEGRVPDKKFDGKIYRNTSLKDVLDILEEGGGVRLKISGKKIIVTS